MPALETKHLAAFTVEEVEGVVPDVRHHRTGDGLARATLVRLRSVLGMALEAVRRGHRGATWAALAVLPVGTAKSAARRSFTVDQARALLAAAQGDRLEALWTVALFRGLRPGSSSGSRGPTSTSTMTSGSPSA
jgi:hypothetical protein